MKKVPKYKNPIVSKNVLPVDYKAMNRASLNSYDLPKEYRDAIIPCRYCGSNFVFSAEHQKHLYEVVKRHIATKKILCEKCRIRIKEIDTLVGALMIKIGKKGTPSVASIIEVNAGIKMIEEKFKIVGRRDSAKYKRLINLTLP